MSKPTLPQGTRDFSAEVVRKRNYIFDTIRTVFELYGFQPLETPVMENLETLMGKYGEEGDKLIFKILDNGELLGTIDKSELAEETVNAFLEQLANTPNITVDKIRTLDKSLSTNEKAKELFTKQIEKFTQKYVRSTYLSKRALRYDLTIPFARYVAMNHGQLNFPFKRYQIQPVWRADRPQKGRYREFYQCDADVVGSYSLLNEVELANIYAEVFKRLNIDVEIRLNNRKILTALAEVCGGVEKMMDITIAIDKLDKIGMHGVKKELQQRELNEEQIKIIEKYLAIDGSNEEKLQQIKSLLGENETGKKGIEELEFVYNYINFKSENQTSDIKHLQLDFTLARGLNYYTGIIYEIKAKSVQMGSVGGGGRYDDLTGLFGVPNLPGVGISFGVDRIYDVMEELKLFPESVHTGKKVLFFNLGVEESKIAYNLMQQLRSSNIKCEIFHEQAKFDKQFKYAEKKNIPFAVIIGTKELQENTCTVKDLKTGEQKNISQTELVKFPLNDFLA